MSLSKAPTVGVNMENLKQMTRNADTIFSINRPHTLWEVRSMNDNERFFALRRRVAQFIEERDGIMSGSIMPWSGTTKSKLLQSCRGRFQRTKLVAGKLGIELDTRLTGEREAEMREIEIEMREMELDET